MVKPATVDEYFAGFAGPAREHLDELRRLSRTAVPRAIESLKWGYPAYIHEDGVILFMLSGHQSHGSVAFTPSTREAFDGELIDFETGKGTVKLPYDEPVPAALLKRMIAFRVHEYEQNGVKWM